MISPPRTVVESLNRGLHAVMERDTRVHFIGEDVLDPYGGAFKVARGLSSRFPDRVWTTPISEAAITGLGVGMAMRGLRPVVEIMFGDFLTLAADQLINHAAKCSWMFNEEVQVPLVVRTPMGGRRGYGPTHSQSLEKHFLGVPGLWVVAPSVVGDPARLLDRAVLGCEEPVLFIESKACYGKPLLVCPDGMRRQEFSTPEDPFETVRLSWDEPERDGLLCCYGGGAPLVLDVVRQLADAEGLLLDVAVLSQLSPTPMSHLAWIGSSPPGFCGVVDEASCMAGWSAELLVSLGAHHQNGAAAVRFARFGSRHEPIGTGRWLEQATLLQPASLAEAILNEF